MLNKVAKKKDKLKVTIISRESDEKTLDVRMLEEELRHRGVRVNVLSKLLTKEKSVKNAVGYPKLAEQGKITILYAPTFRRGAAPNLAGLADALDPEKYNIIVKLHPLYGGGGRLFRDNIIYDEAFETYELIAAADAVISDYSSLVIKETLSDKPLYLYTYDIGEYMQSTGLNMDFASEPIGKYTFKDATDLAKALEEPYDSEALREFGKKYIDVDSAWEDGSCTADLADFIIRIAD